MNKIGYPVNKIGHARIASPTISLENAWEPLLSRQEGKNPTDAVRPPKRARTNGRPSAAAPGQPLRNKAAEARHRRLAFPPRRPVRLPFPCVQQNKALFTSVAAKFLKFQYLSSSCYKGKVATFTERLPRARALCHSARTAGDI